MTEIELGKKKDSSAVQSAPSPLDGPGLALDPAWFEQTNDELPFTRHVLTTPLHLVAAEESGTNKWTEWNGYTVADVYTNFDQEYDALRTRAALSDISPFVKYRISGKESEAYLDRLLTRAASTMSIDSVSRAVVCCGNGAVVTEGLVFRMGAQDFRLTVSSRHLDWMLDAAEGFEVNVEDVSGTIAALSLAGPLAAQILEAAAGDGISVLEKNHAKWAELGGMPVYVSRTGILGGCEYELWCDPSDASVLWKRLFEFGAPYGIKAVGAAVRNVARLEKGIALEGVDYGNSFEAADGLTPLSPFDLGLGNFVDLGNLAFNGRRALKDMFKHGSAQVLTGFEIDVDEQAHFANIYVGERLVGTITSSVWSLSLQRHIALAIIDADALGASGGFSTDVTFRRGKSGGSRATISLAKRPFLPFS